ncbi:hypothetical protein IV203_017408 [Nitzschia inconspicua]|uniref:Uncharacterized protein n=1 Tax=Nitzschia inconspicua TaxID=303405 RepID=A0A9K3P9G1_9STRA|nr:hypothetical protein IV203_017408 [Nitzschia inconspicua]
MARSKPNGQHPKQDARAQQEDNEDIYGQVLCRISRSIRTNNEKAYTDHCNRTHLQHRVCFFSMVPLVSQVLSYSFGNGILHRWKTSEKNNMFRRATKRGREIEERRPREQETPFFGSARKVTTMKRLREPPEILQA